MTTPTMRRNLTLYKLCERRYLQPEISTPSATFPERADCRLPSQPLAEAPHLVANRFEQLYYTPAIPL